MAVAASRNMRWRLQNVIAYHTAMAEAHKPAEETGRRKRNGEPAEASPEQLVHNLHADAAAQLQAVLDAMPVFSGIEQAAAAQSVHRDRSVIPPRRFVH